MSTETETLLVMQSVVVVGMIIKAIVDGYNRKQDRMDRESAARITQIGLEMVKIKGAEREGRILEKIEENTKVSREAFEVANGHNEKIITLTETVKEVAMKAIPQEVHVSNSASDPVHTHQEK